MITNACWTAASASTKSSQTIRGGMGGIAGSSQTCLQTAIDGYTLSGVVTIAKMGNNQTSGTGADVDNNLLAWNELTESTNATHNAMADTTGKYLGTAKKGVNLGSPVAVALDWVNGGDHFWLISANQYYEESYMITVDTSANITVL